MLGPQKPQLPLDPSIIKDLRSRTTSQRFSKASRPIVTSPGVSRNVLRDHFTANGLLVQERDQLLRQPIPTKPTKKVDQNDKSFHTGPTVTGRFTGWLSDAFSIFGAPRNEPSQAQESPPQSTTEMLMESMNHLIQVAFQERFDQLFEQNSALQRRLDWIPEDSRVVRQSLDRLSDQNATILKHLTGLDDRVARMEEIVEDLSSSVHTNVRELGTEVDSRMEELRDDMTEGMMTVKDALKDTLVDIKNIPQTPMAGPRMAPPPPPPPPPNTPLPKIQVMCNCNCSQSGTPTPSEVISPQPRRSSTSKTPQSLGAAPWMPELRNRLVKIRERLDRKTEEKAKDKGNDKISNKETPTTKRKTRRQISPKKQ